MGLSYVLLGIMSKLLRNNVHLHLSLIAFIHQNARSTYGLELGFSNTIINEYIEIF